MNDLLTAALELHAAGLSVVPVAADGSKRPTIAWKQYTETPADLEQITAWFTAPGERGIGIVTGVAGVELLELEGKAMGRIAELTDLLDGTGLLPLYQQVLTGWSEQSPSGGLHLLYRISDAPVPGNTKIAQAPTDGPTGRDTLAETRGTGGFVVTAPTAGAVHPTGKPYLRIAGGPATITTITMEQRNTLHEIVHAALDTMPEIDPGLVELADIWTDSTPRQDGDVTPGDDYESRTDWSEILTGWTLVFSRGTTRYWRRPGKKDGISATTGRAADRDRLYVFTSSTGFEPETPYTKFGAYALLNHGGDHHAAARRLAADGYGRRVERSLVPATPAPTLAGERTTSTGTVLGALATQPAPGTMIRSDEDALTDDGNAQLLVGEHAARLGYVPESGKWVTWTGSRWEWHADDAPAVDAARDVIRRIPTDNPQLATHRKRSMSARALTSAVRLARADERLRIPADRFDAQPWSLNTPAGIIDLRTGHAAAPTPWSYQSKQTPVAPDKAMPTPLWKQFLATTFQHDLPMERYVQRLVGLSAIGEVIEHILPFLHGGGGNGKTVFLETITTLLGDYAIEAPSGFLLAGRDRHETELANLQGRRLVVGSEVNENTRFDEAKMKALTGGDKITARYMRQDYFTFTPTHSLWIAANNQPKVETGGHSFWRRLRLIPFTHTVPENQRIDNLQQRLVDEEGPGILSWIIEGAVDYARDGLDTPNQVLAATHEYQSEEDHLGRFVEDRCIIGGGEHARVDTGELRRAYDQWCRDEDATELNGTAFGRQLKQKYAIGTVKSNGRRFYTNVLLASDETAATDAPSGLFADASDDHIGDPWSTR